MREILFRGKKDSGEWVCGDLIQLHKEAPYWYILPEGISSEMYEDEPYHFRENDVMCSVALAKVIPQTISEFTGLTDKNGKKIFEGDILYPNYWGKLDNKNPILCKFKNGGFCFTERYMWDYANNCKRAWSWNRRFDKRKLKNCEVIGNIYDNPELLEVQNER